MNKKIRNYKYKTITDDITGRCFQRISPEGILAHYPYFYLNMISNGKMLIILEEDSVRNLHILNLANATLEQITFYTSKDNFDDFGPQFINNGKTIIYVSNNQVILHQLESGNTKIVYTPKEGWDTYKVPDISDDGKYLLTIDFPISEYINKDNSNWSDFDEQGKRGLRSQLVRVNIENGHKEILIDTLDYEKYGFKKNQWLGHPQFKPGSNKILSYCHEGRGGTVDVRILLYDYEKKLITTPRPHKYDGEIISHEFFTNDGSKIGFVQIPNNDSKTGSLRFIDMLTGIEETIMNLPRCSHFTTNSTDKYIIADADYPAEPFIHFIDVENKKDIHLVRHNSSMASYGNTQDAHPHPFFSPDSKNIFFVSDMEGYPAIYKCDVSDLTN